MLTEFKNHLRTRFADFSNKQIGMAISGGVDSVVLAHLLYKSEIKLTLLHCNFNLRGSESDGDELFVKGLASKWKIPFVATSFCTLEYSKDNKTSIQIAARELRYKWFAKMANLYKLNFIATAHHADDNLETFIINLTRGSGLEGLTGIPEVNTIYIRPLLPFSKRDILEYAKLHNLQWREDKSNQDTKYLRNKIRHHIVPHLKEVQPNLLDKVNQTVDYLKQSQQLINTYVQEKKQKLFKTNEAVKGFKINIEDLLKEAHLKLFLFESLKEYGFRAWDDVENLLTAESGKKIVSSTHVLLKDRGFLLLYKNVQELTVKEYLIKKEDKSIILDSCILHLESKNSNDQIKPSAQSIYIDETSIAYPLVVRKWRKGDYFYPNGMGGRKKLGKYFKDEKYTLSERKNTWLLCSENEIIWIIGRRSDRRFQVNSKTKNSIKITYEATS